MIELKDAIDYTKQSISKGKSPLTMARMRRKSQYYPLIISLLLTALLLWFLFGNARPAHALTQNQATKFGVLLTIDGAISPASEDYFRRGLNQAVEDGAQLVVLQLDTPGGLDKSMRRMIKSIINSPIPVITYVAPSGARAASAGTYILYASHIAAMAPGTNLGAATPVKIGGGGGLPGTTPDKEQEQQKQNEKKAPKAQSAMEAKIINDASAYIRGLAKLRDRNATWAEKAVREGASLSAGEALKLNVIDIVAPSIAKLLQQANGRQVKVRDRTVTIASKDLPLKSIQPDWRNRFLAVISDPSVAYILMLVGIYGLLFEFINPGFIVPGVVGAICLLLALYSLHLLPINYTGLALMLLGIAFMVAEAFVPSFGILGIGGIIAFVIGSILLLDTGGNKAFGIAWQVIVAMVIINVGFFFFIIGMAIKARLRKVVSGREAMLNKIGIVLSPDASGTYTRAKFEGETWNIKSDQSLKAGQQVQVIAMDGLLLIVKPKEES